VSGPNGAILVRTPGAGGHGIAPSPGWLMRAAHAACDATLIAMKAAEEGVELSHLEVVPDSVSDDRGLLGMSDDVPAGPISIRVRINVAATGTTERRLREIVEWAREHSPVDNVYRACRPGDRRDPSTAVIRILPVRARRAYGRPRSGEPRDVCAREGDFVCEQRGAIEGSGCASSMRRRSRSSSTCSCLRAATS